MGARDSLARIRGIAAEAAPTHTHTRKRSVVGTLEPLFLPTTAQDRYKVAWAVGDIPESAMSVS